ncbi:hypothetical protein [Legionella sp. W05-934-2]|uniref:hypothetical protein n=1 Tax=Legionella sp. W05-934-2 TaxID=1198649 RepID=UPI003462895E
MNYFKSLNKQDSKQTSHSYDSQCFDCMLNRYTGHLDGHYAFESIFQDLDDLSVEHQQALLRLLKSMTNEKVDARPQLTNVLAELDALIQSHQTKPLSNHSPTH